MRFYSLKDVIDTFEQSLDTVHKRNQYVPKIRDYLIPYIEQNISFNESPEGIEQLFQYDITRNHLIESTIHYVKNPNVISETGINDYIIAFVQFFDFLRKEHIENSNITKLISIDKPTTIKKEIIEKIDKESIKKLNPPIKDPPINDDEFKFILSYCKEIDESNYKDFERAIIIKLLLFLGLKASKLYNLKHSDFDYDSGVLKIPSEANNKGYEIHLPYSLTISLRKLKEYQTKNFIETNGLLFLTDKEKKITHTWISELLSEIKNYYNAQYEIDSFIFELESEKNHFTQTGLIKYSIIKMIEKGINPSVIQDFTGHGLNTYNDCQEIVNQTKLEEKNRYLDSKLRSIETYDLL